MTRDDLKKLLPDGTSILPTEFDGAFCGIAMRGETVCAVYDKAKVCEVYEADGMAPDEAEEFFYYNTEGAYVGPSTPFFVDGDRWPT